MRRAFCGKKPIHSKTDLENKTLEQVLKYLECDMIRTRTSKINSITSKEHEAQYIEPWKARSKIEEVKLYKTMATSLIMYGKEWWIITKRTHSKIQAES